MKKRNIVFGCFVLVMLIVLCGLCIDTHTGKYR